MTSLEDIEARWKALYEEIKPYGTTLDAPLAETSLFTMDDKKSGIVKKTNELIKQMECVTENLERSGLMDDLSDETLEQQDAYRVEAARFQELAQNYRLFNFVALAISALALCASLWQVVNKSEWNKPPLIRRSRERN